MYYFLTLVIKINKHIDMFYLLSLKQKSIHFLSNFVSNFFLVFIAVVFPSITLYIAPTLERFNLTLTKRVLKSSVSEFKTSKYIINN